MNCIQGKVALVTGGARGIGRAISLALADAGVDVAINTGASEPAADELADEIVKTRSVRCRAYATDIADEAGVKAMIARIEDEFGRIDILVNNAGITRDRSFLTMTRAMWDEVLGVNLNGPFNVTNAVIQRMVNYGWGRVINISSMGSQTGNLGQARHTVTMGGIIAFTMTLARELARKGITVNAVSPGYIATEVTAAMTESARTQACQMIPMGRMADPGEVAAAVLFLASPRASYITGQVIGVNGGMYM